MILIKLPRLSWDGKDLEDIYTVLQGAPELGFLYKASIRDHIRENESRGTLWAAYWDEQLVGVATIGSRRSYPHLTRHGEITVIPEYRRRRIGTALYFVQILQSLLEGRREVEDTIIPELSPWMSGPTECQEGIGFLPSLEYSLLGTLPRRTSGFKDIQLWGKCTYNLDRWLDRIPTNSDFELLDTPKMRATFEKNLKNYENHDPDLVQTIQSCRDWIFETFQRVEVMQNEQEE